ncbi:MAG: glycosyltransferase [Rubrivivax sp.]|jgi:hypothetical protein
MQRAFLADRFGACHFLEPVLTGEPNAFFANGDHEPSQRRWAFENGLGARASLEEILRSQIEQHRTEVFYNLDPMRYGSSFIRNLPGCVRLSIAWRAAPSPGADFGAYDLVVCNFTSILESYRQRGWKADWFAPSHDPVMSSYATRNSRPIDVLFIGGYTRHHRRRAEVLEAIATKLATLDIIFHLDESRLTRLAESPLGHLPPLRKLRRPDAIRRFSRSPVFGKDLYESIANAKIVFNGAVDMAGPDRGNMRCFEALGCGALLVSDAGNYPTGMENGETILTYETPSDAVRVIRSALDDSASTTRIAKAGTQMLETVYSKRQQWQAFQKLVEAL